MPKTEVSYKVGSCLHDKLIYTKVKNIEYLLYKVTIFGF